VSPATLQFLDAVADSFNPLIAAFALALPLLRKPRRPRAIAAYSVAGAMAIAMVYVIRAIDAHLQIWDAMGLDFSTHSAFAASVAVSIGVFSRRARLPLLVLVLAYFGLELLLRYHTLADVLSSALPAAAVALAFHLAAARAT
jgi:hypothetical protein